MIALGGGLLAAELADQDRGDAAVGAWVATTGTLAGAGLLVAALRERVSHVDRRSDRGGPARPADAGC